MACLPELQTLTLVVHQSRGCPSWKIQEAVRTLIDPHESKADEVPEYASSTLKACEKRAKKGGFVIGKVELRVKMIALDGKQCYDFKQPDRP